jgi:hypothetical protein
MEEPSHLAEQECLSGVCEFDRAWGEPWWRRTRGLEVAMEVGAPQHKRFRWGLGRALVAEHDVNQEAMVRALVTPSMTNNYLSQKLSDQRCTS